MLALKHSSDSTLCENIYFLSLNMKLKIKQATVNTSPAIAKRVYTTLRGIAIVTVSSLGIPSIGTPSVIGKGEGMGENYKKGKRASYKLYVAQ